jgi:hypothetical protein
VPNRPSLSLLRPSVMVFSMPLSITKRVTCRVTI